MECAIACSDLWWAFDYLDPEQRQLYWAHLLRDFTTHAEGLGAQKQFGRERLQIAGRLFEAWDTYRQDGDRLTDVLGTGFRGDPILLLAQFWRAG